MSTFTVTSFIVTSTILSGVFAVILFYIKRLRFYKLASSLPGPPVLPIIGNAHLFLGTPTKESTRMVLSYFNKYPSIFRLWLGPALVVVVEDPEYVKALLVNHKLMQKAFQYKFLEPFFGTGLLTTSAKHWRTHRRLLQPTFNTPVLESFMTTFVTNAKVFVQRMEVDSRDQEVNVLEYVSMCTLDTVCETTLGINVGAQETDDVKFKRSLDTLATIIMDRMTKLWLYPDIIFNLSPDGRTYKELSAFMEERTTKVIRDKKEELFGNKHCQPKKNDTSDAGAALPRRKVLLDLLLEMTFGENKSFSDNQIRYDINTIAAVGNDTTALGTTFLMLVLATYPDVQEKVFNELCEIFEPGENFERDITTKDLKRMEYLDRVIKETLRVFPVAPVFGRETTEDVDIGDHIIPKNVTILIGVLALHRNERYWPDPLKFDPDRFLPEEILKRHTHAYIPFGAGPRNCIGMRYAGMIIKVICATILRRNIIKKDIVVPIEDIELSVDIALKPIIPITLKLERRMLSIRKN